MRVYRNVDSEVIVECTAGVFTVGAKTQFEEEAKESGKSATNIIFIEECFCDLPELARANQLMVSFSCEWRFSP